MIGRSASSFKRTPNHVIVYDGEVTEWDRIWEIHPLKSVANKPPFISMANCTEAWGRVENNSGIRVLRSAYTWKQLAKIAENSLEDCQTFYDIAKHCLYNEGDLLGKEIDRWFKIALTAIYIGYPDAPESLNYSSQLTQQSLEKSVSLAFQHFGTLAFTRYKKLKNKIKIDNLNEKIVLWYWEVDGRETNLMSDILDKIIKKDGIKFDTDFISNNLKLKNLMKYQSLVINEKYVPFDKLSIVAEKCKVEEAGRVCLFYKNQEKVSLSSIFNLFIMQDLLKTIEPKNSSPSNSMRHIDGKYYSSFKEMFEVHPLLKDAQDSMLRFVELNLELAKNKKTVESQNFWEKSLREVHATILNENLSVHDSDSVCRKIKI